MPETACLYLLLFLCMLPCAQIIFGVGGLNECPRQPYIPIYLIVMGAFCLISLFCSLNLDVMCPFYDTCHSLMFFFFSCWLIAGDVWIYSIYEPNYNKTTTDVEPYCDKTVYLFAFCTTTLSSILYLLLACCCGCCFGLAVYENQNDDSED